MKAVSILLDILIAIAGLVFAVGFCAGACLVTALKQIDAALAYAFGVRK